MMDDLVLKAERTNQLGEGEGGRGEVKGGSEAKTTLPNLTSTLPVLSLIWRFALPLSSRKER